MFKKFLLVAFLFVTISAFSQVRKPIFIVPDSTTAYGVTMPANSLIFDSQSNRIWTLTSSVLSTDNVSTSSKILITQPGGVSSGLSDVLNSSNTTSDGQTIDALNGGGSLNLRDGTDGFIKLGTDKTNILLRGWKFVCKQWNFLR